VFIDAIQVKIREGQVVQNKPACIAIGAGADGEKHVLGIWLSRTQPGSAAGGQGARFWGSVMTDLKNRGVRDVLIACADGLAGFADAITSAFPSTVVQRCVVHYADLRVMPTWRRELQVAA
jgi:putative transposase